MHDHKPNRRITFRRVSLEHTHGRNEPVVFCPRTLTVTNVDGCRSCERFSGLCLSRGDTGAFLRCAFSDDEPVGLKHEDLASDSFPMGICRAPVSEIMTSPVRSVTPEESLEDVAAIFSSESIGALPVIDAEGKVRGIITKSDALQRYYEHAEEQPLADAIALIERTNGGSERLHADDPEITVREVMTHQVYTIGDHASISRVAALMAYEHVHHIVLVDDRAQVTGIVSSLDIARWVARADGYVVPRRGSKSPPQ